MAKSIKLPDETYWDSTGIAHEKQALNEIIESLLNKADIVESDTTWNNGCIRFSNGIQLAWKCMQVTAGGNAWGNVYYSDHDLGDWAKAFLTCYVVTPYVNSLQFWGTIGNAGAISAGTFRCFRPNASTASIWIGCMALGRWK